MSQPRPVRPGRSIWRGDLGHILNLPGLRPWSQRWRTTLAANLSSRREGKSVFFDELAEALRQGAPLTLALETNSQNLGEARDSVGKAQPKGANTRGAGYAVLLALALIVFPIGLPMLAFFLLLSARNVDAERVARLLAMRLLPHVEKGLGLAEAMERTGDYSSAELETIRAAERYNAVPDGLRRLANRAVADQRLLSLNLATLYPLLILLIVTLVGGFIMWMILPKFVDIFDQLGIALPEATLRLIVFAEAFNPIHIFSTYLAILFLMFCVRAARRAYGARRVIPCAVAVVIVLGLFAASAVQPLSLLLSLIVLAVVFLLVRGLMNGGRAAQGLLAVLAMLHLLPVAGLLAVLAVWIIDQLLTLSGAQSGDFVRSLDDGAQALIGGISAVVTIVIFTPWMVETLERGVIGIEETINAAGRRIPGIARAFSAEAESRWLAALALGLQSGVLTPAALRQAGAVAGGPMRGRSDAAAELAEKGLPLGQSCLQSHVLPGRFSHRIAFLEGGSKLHEGLQEIAGDAAAEAEIRRERLSRIGAVCGLVVVGIFACFIAYALYMPLFAIPTLLLDQPV
ncbi:MAG: type II secretion system F family protein [Sumerlaeia bacterium]